MTYNPHIHTPHNMARGFKMYLYWSGQRRAMAKSMLDRYKRSLFVKRVYGHIYTDKLEGDKLRAMLQHCEDRANWWRRWLLELNESESDER